MDLISGETIKLKKYGKIGFVLILIACLGCTSSFLDASRKGKINDVKKYLEDNTDVNYSEKNGETALMLAAGNGHTDVVRLLIKNGADVNLTDYRERSALVEAAWRGQLEVVKLLLDNGADIHTCQSHPTYSPLISACRGRNADVIQLLIDYGADVNGVCRNTIPLNEAWGERAVEALLNNGAYVNLPPEDRFKRVKPPLVKAMRSGNKKVVSLLLNKGAKRPENESWLMVPHNILLKSHGLKSTQFARLPEGRHHLTVTYFYEDKLSKMMYKRPDPTIKGSPINLMLNAKNGKIYTIECSFSSDRRTWKAWVEEIR
jgi:hypothetical protein